MFKYPGMKFKIQQIDTTTLVCKQIDLHTRTCSITAVAEASE